VASLEGDGCGRICHAHQVEVFMKRVLALAAMFLASPVLAQQAVPQIPFESVPNFL
jgi:hypothetical protein